MQLGLVLDAIYQGSICRLNAADNNAFSITIANKVLALNKGRQDETGLHSTEDKGRHQIEAVLLDSMQELASGQPGHGSASRHGMSYFPFVASHLSLTLTVSSPLQNLTLEAPAAFRIIWRSACATGPNQSIARLSTSFGDKTSLYVFSWDEEQTAGQFQLEFDIRIGGPNLLRAAYFPLYYYLIALLAIAAAACSDHTNLFLGALAAAWVFLLRHLNSCELPRRNVLLFGATFALGVILLLWGVSWRIHHLWPRPWTPFVLAAEALATLTLVGAGLRAIRNFEASGTLPNWLC